MLMRKIFILQEFKKNFDELYITSLNPESLEDSARQQLYTLAEVVQEVLLFPMKFKKEQQACKRWEEVNYDGTWVRNSTAGGPPRTGAMGEECWSGLSVFEYMFVRLSIFPVCPSVCLFTSSPTNQPPSIYPHPPQHTHTHTTITTTTMQTYSAATRNTYFT